MAKGCWPIIPSVDVTFDLPLDQDHDHDHDHDHLQAAMMIAAMLPPWIFLSDVTANKKDANTENNAKSWKASWKFSERNTRSSSIISSVNTEPNA